MVEEPPRIVDVKIRKRADGKVEVDPVWSNVDRPMTGGWICKAELAPRLAKALLAGVVCLEPKRITDVRQRTFVSYKCAVQARQMNADLKRLGF